MRDVLTVTLTALVVAVPAYTVGNLTGRSDGYDKRIAETAVADAAAEIRRKGEDAKLQSMSDFDLCVAGLGGRGVSIAACEQLRGVRSE